MVLLRAEGDEAPWRAGPLSMAWRSVRQIASRMPAGSQRHYRHRHVFVHCGQSLQSMIPTMIIEPAATTTEQITDKSSRTCCVPWLRCVPFHLLMAQRFGTEETLIVLHQQIVRDLKVRLKPSCTKPCSATVLPLWGFCLS